MPMHKERYKAVWLRMLAVREIRMARDVRKLLKSHGKQIGAAYLNQGHAGAETEADKLEATWVRLLIPSYTVTMRDFTSFLLEQMGLKGIKANFSDLTRNFIEREALRKAKGLTKTTKEIITRTISAGNDAAISGALIAANIVSNVGGDVSKGRAQTIARTETHMAAGYGMHAQASEVQFPVTKTWVAIEDDRTRETHTFVDGTEISQDDYFDVGNDRLLYPGDPDGSAGETINCRCTLIYQPSGNAFSEAIYE